MQRLKNIVRLSLVFLVLTAFTGNTELQLTEAHALEGTWAIDLRPTPDSDPYLQKLTVKIRKDGSFSGSFYGSRFRNGQTNTDWALLYFAFRTEDKNNVYFHSGYLKDGELHGMSYCPERKFTTPWSGKRLKD